VAGVVASGAIALSWPAASGCRAVTAVLGPGKLFGLEAALPPGRVDPAGAPLGFEWPADGGFARPARPEVCAVVDAAVALMSPGRLAGAAASDIETAAWLAERLHERLLDAERRLAAALTLPVADRVLAALRDLARDHGTRVHGTAAGGAWVRVELPIRQDLLAAMAGATRESVNRALGALRTRGMVRWMDGRYVVASPAPGAS
jgi:CRP-like cAMP-binding protein